MPITKLLALNRGEIAIRIFRATNELKIRTAAVYSDEDRLSLHRFKADEAYLIGEGKGPVQAYLDVEGIVALAKERGVDAIHPGYGFLSENPALPRACAAAGITFVGPNADLLDLLGDKTAARRLAQKAGLPVVPGTEEPVTAKDDAQAIADKIGYPLIVKAAFGGGGRGMRVVQSAQLLLSGLQEARAEAGASFGNDAVFLERYIRRARHIEVQILADTHGNILHLHERDCSVQRRNQKVVEVAPAVNLDPKIRKGLADAAVALARESKYYSAATVEFLVDADSGEWYFIEVNPRVQVEHTVTEMVTGIDIVQSQIQIAQGFSLHGPEMNLPRQKDISLNGYALQCRVTTEDPANGFLPDYGKIQTYRSPGWLRDPPRWSVRVRRRRHHSVLRFLACEGDGVGARISAGLPPDGPLASGIPHSRREDEHSVSRERRESRTVSGGRRHDFVSRRDARAVSIRAIEGPRHARAALPWRSHRERKSRSRGQAQAALDSSRASARAHSGRAAGGHAPAS